jgi:hypothetical protein
MEEAYETFGACIFSPRKKTSFMQKYQNVCFVNKKWNTLSMSYPRKESRWTPVKSKQSRNGQTKQHIKTKGIPRINTLLLKIYKKLCSFDNNIVKLIKEKFLPME